LLIPTSTPTMFTVESTTGSLWKKKAHYGGFSSKEAAVLFAYSLIESGKANSYVVRTIENTQGKT
jgi:hypothetical protein